MNTTKARSIINKLHKLAINTGTFTGEAKVAAAKAIFIIKKHDLDSEFTTILADLNKFVSPSNIKKRSTGIWGCCTDETCAVAHAIIRAGSKGLTMKNIKNITGLRNTYHCLCDKFAANGLITITKHGRIKIFTVTAKGLASI